MVREYTGVNAAEQVIAAFIVTVTEFVVPEQLPFQFLKAKPGLAKACKVTACPLE